MPIRNIINRQRQAGCTCCLCPHTSDELEELTVLFNGMLQQIEDAVDLYRYVAEDRDITIYIKTPGSFF